jgi:hypothetical protein
MSHGPQLWRKGPNGDEVYCPGRDVVNIFPSMLRQLVARFNQNYWPDVLTNTAQLMNVDEDTASAELVKANDAFFKFLQECCRNSTEKYVDVMKRVGWDDVAMPARHAFHTMLGAILSGLMFSSLRDVSTEGDVPPPFVKPLLEFHLHEARRHENGISSYEEGIAEFRRVIRNCRSAEISYDDLTKVLESVKLGTTA